MSRAEARAEARRAREALDPAWRLRAHARILAHLLDTPEWARARVVASFWSTDEEVDLRPLLALRGPRRLALPRVVRRGAPLAFHAVDRPPTARSRFGVLEPEADAPLVAPEDIDLVVVPALIVDARGYRLGYGGGFYDRTLPGCTRAASIAVLYDALRAPDTRPEPWDVAVHALVTERGITRFRAPEGAAPPGFAPAP